MKCYEIELNGETIKLRLTSEAIIEIEKKNKEIKYFDNKLLKK